MREFGSGRRVKDDRGQRKGEVECRGGITAGLNNWRNSRWYSSQALLNHENSRKKIGS